MPARTVSILAAFLGTVKAWKAIRPTRAPNGWWQTLWSHVSSRLKARGKKIIYLLIIFFGSAKGSFFGEVY